MAIVTTIEARGRVIGVGDAIVYKCVLSGGDTSGTITDTYFSKLLDLSIVDSAADTQGTTSKDVYFDGTNIKIAGCKANGTVYVWAVGTH